MSVPLVVIGAGGFGREVLDVVEAINSIGSQPQFSLLGVLDSSPSERNLLRLRNGGIEFIGSEMDWIREQRRTHFLVGIGSPAIRKRIAGLFIDAGFTPATAIHPGSSIGSGSTVGPGSVVCAGAVISTNVVLGSNCHINPNATIGHDTYIEDFVSINPAATVSGDVMIRQAALIGAGAVILQGLEIGESATIGASSCVTRSVPAGKTVKGVPAC